MHSADIDNFAEQRQLPSKARMDATGHFVSSTAWCYSLEAQAQRSRYRCFETFYRAGGKLLLLHQKQGTRCSQHQVVQ